jgi:hypothetical protein
MNFQGWRDQEQLRGLGLYQSWDNKTGRKTRRAPGAI